MGTRVTQRLWVRVIGIEEELLDINILIMHFQRVELAQMVAR